MFKDASTRGRILVSIGLLINSSAILIRHFAQPSDFVLGCVFGLGIGVIITGLVLDRKYKKSIKQP